MTTERTMGVPPMDKEPQADGIRRGAYLPHWDKESAIYAITYRLADSVPQALMRFMKAEKEDIVQTAKQMKRELSSDEVTQLHRLQSMQIDQILDGGRGHCWLKQDAIASVVAEAFTHFDGEKYQLFAWCIMPNHIHIVLKLLQNVPLQKIIHVWKSFTAKEANKILKRQGVFWHAEYYDHVVRNTDELMHSIAYTWENPDKAGFSNWKWRWKISESALEKALN